MPFIGNQPALSYTSFAKQDFTTSATTSYTLDNPVTNANELALFINFVRQEPGSYSASGTSLTLTEATSASDDMYCVYLGKAVQTVNPPNASVGTSQLVDGAVTSAKLASGTGGKVLQVVQTVKTDTFSTTATSYTAVTGLSVAITPSSSSSKILVMVAISLGTSSYTAHYSLRRDGTDILLADAASNRARTTAVASPTDYAFDRTQEIVNTTYLDSPSTTSATTYQAFIKCRDTSQTVYVNRSHNDNDAATFDPRTTSTITVMEIGA